MLPGSAISLASASLKQRHLAEIVRNQLGTAFKDVYQRLRTKETPLQREASACLDANTCTIRKQYSLLRCQIALEKSAPRSLFFRLFPQR